MCFDITLLALNCQCLINVFNIITIPQLEENNIYFFLKPVKMIHNIKRYLQFIALQAFAPGLPSFIYH